MKITITIILTFIFFVFGSIKADWQPQSSGVAENLQDVYFTSEISGCVVGNSGRILLTINGGTNWKFEAVSGTTQSLFAVDFPSIITGYAVGGIRYHRKNN